MTMHRFVIAYSHPDYPDVVHESKVTANCIDIGIDRWEATDDHMGDVVASSPIVPGSRVVLGMEAS